MAHALFRSIRNVKTQTQVAVEVAENTIEEYRMARMTAGSEAPETEYTLRLLKTLAVLMKGPHGAAVRPIAEQAFPVLVAPQGQA